MAPLQRRQPPSLAAAQKAKGINDRMETARAELAGAKLARDAVTQHSMDVDPSRSQGRHASDHRGEDRQGEHRSRAPLRMSTRNFGSRGGGSSGGERPRGRSGRRTRRYANARCASGCTREERAERQIGRALSRADGDLQHKDQKLKELGFAKDPGEARDEEIERKAEIVRRVARRSRPSRGVQDGDRVVSLPIATCQTALDV